MRHKVRQGTARARDAAHRGLLPFSGRAALASSGCAIGESAAGPHTRGGAAELRGGSSGTNKQTIY